MRRTSAIVAVAAAGLVLGGCVSTEEVGGSDNPTPPTTTVVPTVGSTGTDVTAAGVVATVVDIAPFDQSPVGVPRIAAVMRSENLTDHVTHNPDVTLRCDETSETGDWYRGSTWEPNTVLPVNVVSQGQVIIGFPPKSDNPEYPVVTCTGAALRMTIEGVRGEPSTVVDIPVPDEVLRAAVLRPRGPTLPVASDAG